MKSKAIFLLVIFLLNTVVGLCCALGMYGGHDEDHTHAEAVRGHVGHVHHHAGGHGRTAAVVQGANFSQIDPCCQNLVNNLVTQSKLVPENGKAQLMSPVLFLLGFAYTLSVPVIAELDQRVFIDQRERPPNADRRIFIQSFQI